MRNIDENGLKWGIFGDDVTTYLGQDGANLIALAIHQQTATIMLKHWLYVLVSKENSCLHKQLVVRCGKDSNELIELFEKFLSDLQPDSTVNRQPTIIHSVNSNTCDAAIDDLLNRAMRITADHQCERINEPALSLALLQTIEEKDAILNQILHSWCGDQYGVIIRNLKVAIKPRLGGSDTLFSGSDDLLDESLFSYSGRQFLQRFKTDMAGFCVHKVMPKHMLYSLLGDEASALVTGLSLYGINVKDDLHTALSRDLRYQKRQQNVCDSQFQLSKDTLMRNVQIILERAFTISQVHQLSGISETAIQLAFLEKAFDTIERFLSEPNAMLSENLLRYVESGLEEPEEEVSESERFSIAEIEERIKSTIFGQDHAITRIIPWIKRMRFGIPRDGRPAGVFLFLGPTGSGKTQMAKELARYLFGDPDMIIFLEMGQFKSKESMNTFIGAPPGYVGYGEGKLTNGLRDKPRSVVLFDEIEKANTQVFDTLLRFADEGVISDPAGPTRDGQQCIIVLTTNAGQKWLRAQLKKNPDAIENPDGLIDGLFKAAMDELDAEGFRPEFLGRLDERIVFTPFSISTCRQILDNSLQREVDKFQNLKNVTLSIPDEVRDAMAREVFTRSLDEGARAAPRVVNTEIVTPAIDILSNYEESGTPLPPNLFASICGMNDDGKCHIKIEKG